METNRSYSSYQEIHLIQVLELEIQLKLMDLNISRAAFCGGESPHRYVKDFGVHLFLSSSLEDVKVAIESNVAAATIISKASATNTQNNDG